MIIKAIGRISTRGANKELIQYNRGDTLVVPDDEGERLIKLKVATYEGESSDSDYQEVEDTYLSEDKLKKLDKPKLVEYAASIGLQLEQSSKKEELMNLIIDFMEEQKDMEE